MNEESDLANVHRQFVNAERGDDGIPSYFKERLDLDHQNDLVKFAVFKELWYNEDIIHSTESLRSDFQYNKETIRSRLNEMVESGVLKKGFINNGDIWWINFPDSEYPLARDAVLHPMMDDEEMTANEFLTQSHIVIGIISLAAIALGGLMVLFGAFQLDSGSAIPIPAEAILSIGLMTLLSSYISLIMAVVAWIVNMAFEKRDLKMFFSGDS